MIRRRLWIAAVLFVAMFPFEVFSQDVPRKIDVYGGIGSGRFYDDEGSLGSGITYRAGMEWRPLSRLALRGELLGLHHRRDDYFRVRGDAVAVSANAVYYFSRSRVQPYVYGGVGFLKVKHSYGWPASSNEIFTVSRIDPGINLGAGVRIFLNRRWSLDPQTSAMFDTGHSAYSLINFFSVNVAYHW